LRRQEQESDLALEAGGLCEAGSRRVDWRQEQEGKVAPEAEEYAAQIAGG